MATQADVDALTARLKTVEDKVDALPVGSANDLDLTGLATGVSNLEASVDAKAPTA